MYRLRCMCRHNNIMLVISPKSRLSFFIAPRARLINSAVFFPWYVTRSFLAVFVSYLPWPCIIVTVSSKPGELRSVTRYFRPKCRAVSIVRSYCIAPHSVILASSSYRRVHVYQLVRCVCVPCRIRAGSAVIVLRNNTLVSLHPRIHPATPRARQYYSTWCCRTDTRPCKN